MLILLKGILFFHSRRFLIEIQNYNPGDTRRLWRKGDVIGVDGERKELDELRRRQGNKKRCMCVYERERDDSTVG